MLRQPAERRRLAGQPVPFRLCNESIRAPAQQNSLQVSRLYRWKRRDLRRAGIRRAGLNEIFEDGLGQRFIAACPKGEVFAVAPQEPFIGHFAENGLAENGGQLRNGVVQPGEIDCVCVLDRFAKLAVQHKQPLDRGGRQRGLRRMHAMRPSVQHLQGVLARGFAQDKERPYRFRALARTAAKRVLDGFGASGGLSGAADRENERDEACHLGGLLALEPAG